jgi:hypothetical protein
MIRTNIRITRQWPAASLQKRISGMYLHESLRPGRMIACRYVDQAFIAIEHFESNM